jgi:CheY-like chemotaxis protein
LDGWAAVRLYWAASVDRTAANCRSVSRLATPKGMPRRQTPSGSVDFGGTDMGTNPVVLVVDDDPDIRSSVVQALEDGGMTGIPAASGHEALRILGGDRTISILLTDVMMPGITGTTLADRANELRPDVKIVFMTAYAAADPIGSTRPRVGKPFRTSELCASIRAMYKPA